MRPSLGGMKPVIMRMVVDLPAPFGPRKPSPSPRSTLNEMPSTARLAPKAFTSPSIFIMGPDYRRIGRLKSTHAWRFRHENRSLHRTDCRRLLYRGPARQYPAGAGAALSRE